MDLQFTFDPSPLIKEVKSGDPVDNFFQRLPPPKKDYSSTISQQTPKLVRNACEMLCVESMFRQSTDPDAGYLLEHAMKAHTERVPLKYIYQRLVMLALDKGIADDDDSLKARQLRFYRWIVHGRKDETAHFGPGSNGSPDLDISKALLPESPAFNKCAECGNEGASKQCSGCSIRNGSRTTFAISYCGKECQQNHWKKHKSLCRQMQQLHRAMSLFQDIFDHFLTLVFLLVEQPKQIAEENGIVVVRFAARKTSSPSQGPAMPRFNFELAPSPDIARTILTHSACGLPLSAARGLFEMLIRPSCAKIQNLGFEPKNMHRPVHIIQGDWHDHNALTVHEIAVATLPCGMTVALDATGMQFGWKENISPWSTYKQHRVNYICKENDLAPDSPGLQEDESFGGPRDLTNARALGMAVTEKHEQLIMETTVMSLTSQIKTRYGDVKNFLRLKENEFIPARTAVLAAAKRGLTMLADEMGNSALPKRLVLRSPAPREAFTTGRAGDMDLIWCRSQDANAPVERQNRRWKARWEPVIKVEFPRAQED